ncbi:MAG: arsenite methyltransferase, partial [Phycisphaerales bacterium]
MSDKPCCSPSCCDTPADGTNVTSVISEKYAETARSGLSSKDAGVRAVAEAFGYSADELAVIPAEANMGLSCGNPIALANLRPGEVVLDLGSGGGLDVFLAAQKVGPTGKAIGVDMTPDMIALARRNAQKGPDGKPYTNVEFKLGEIDSLPLADNSVDVIISNCVINLAPDKTKVFAEMARVLKPGGRVAVSDIALKAELPEELARNVAALVGCIAGAIRITDYEKGLRSAGFEHVAVIDSGADLTAYAKVEGQAGCCAPVGEATCCSTSNTPAKPMHRDLGELFKKYDVNAYAASVKVFAV